MQGQNQNQHQNQSQNQRPPQQPQMQRPPQGQHAAPPQGRPAHPAQNQQRPAQGYGPPSQQGQRSQQGGYQNQPPQNQHQQGQHSQNQNQRPQHPQQPHNQQRQPMQGGGNGGGQRPPAPYQNQPQNQRYDQRPPAPHHQHDNNQGYGSPPQQGQRPQQNYAPQAPQQRAPQQPYQQPPQQNYQQPQQNYQQPQQNQYQQPAPPPQHQQRPPQNQGYAPAQSPRPPQHYQPTQQHQPMQQPQAPRPPQQQPPLQSQNQQSPQQSAPRPPQQRPPQQPQPQPPRQSQPQNYYTPAPRQAPQPPAPPAPQPPAYQPQARQPQAAPPASAPAAPQHIAPAYVAPQPPPAPAAVPHNAPPAREPKAASSKPPRHVSAINQKAIDEIFDKATRFADLGLTPEALQGVTDSGFEFPTSIQARIIPLLLAGKDVLGQAKTGTGKTAAFGLPLLSRIKKGDALSAIILVPTRELAIQVATDLTRLGKHCGLTVLPVYGGQNITTQAQRLQRGPEIIVATPGRLMDMRERGYVHYNNIKIAILDEVDRMLDIGFRDDIRRILGGCPKDRQTVFVSATLPAEVEALARTFARDAEKIVATSGSLTASMVQQFHLPVEAWDKKQLLLHLLTHESPALTIVFCRTKRTVDNLAEYLFRKGIDAHAIHGDMYQAKRNQVIEKLKSGSLGVLIASDLASRGLDVEGISHVINYDLPDDPDLYIHRIGRTARAGRDGVAWSLVTPEQGGLLTEIEMLINAEIPKLDYPDFKPGPLPADVAADRAKDAARRTDGPKPVSRFASTLAVPVQATATVAAPPVDASRFPGGIIPSKLPDRRMGGKVRSARSMRNAPPAPALPPTNAPADPAPTPPEGT